MQGTEQKLGKLVQEKRQRAWSRSIAEMQRGQRMAIDLASETKKRGGENGGTGERKIKGRMEQESGAERRWLGRLFFSPP